ncbi:MAG: HAD hydrolase-like protein [Oscillospiraceae bacterium]|nr:HAD hydrolase-like protein [Oscillospiraceae bacterium]
MIETVLFDFDGTISDSARGITKCVQYALSKFGIKVDDLSELVCFVGPPPPQMFKEKYGFSDEQALKGLEYFRERYRASGINENDMYPGVATMLERLRRAGKKTALATSKPRPFAVHICENYGISELFDYISGSGLDNSKMEKSDVIDDVLEKLGITEAQKDSVIMVGDRKYDIIGAHQCGIKCVGVTYGYAENGELSEYGADHICDSVYGLTEFLLNN